MANIRRAGPLDCRPLAELLNQGAVQPVSGDELADLMAHPGAIWHVAEVGGAVVGAQWVEASDTLPPQAVTIASFVQSGQDGLEISSALFEATKRAARKAGYGWINADVRAANESGLAYYQSRGFRVWERGAEVIRMSFDLD